jgi:hypothetical protein
MEAFLTGGLLKLYDDFVDDEPYITNPYAKTTLQYLQVMAVTLLIANDFWFGAIFAAFNGLCAFSSFEEYTGPHVFAFFILCPILLVWSWRQRSRVSLHGMDVAVITVLLGLALYEPQMYPEETSVFKMVTRSWVAICSFTAARVFPLHPSVVSVLLFQAGYCAISSLNQMFKLSTNAIPPINSSVSTTTSIFPRNVQ